MTDALAEKKATDYTDYTERRSLWFALRKTTLNPLNPCNPWLDSVRAIRGWILFPDRFGVEA